MTLVPHKSEGLELQDISTVKVGQQQQHLPLFGQEKVAWHLRVKLPRKLRNYLIRRLGRASVHPITHLNASFDIKDTIKDFKHYRWSHKDSVWIFIGLVAIWDIVVIKALNLPSKMLICLLFISTLGFPALRQGFLPFVPVFVWVCLFYSCQSIPKSWRPAIWVNILPAIEHSLYGANLSETLSRNINTFFDILAWIPYGVVHFVAPFIISIIAFVFGPPGYCPCFAKTFGYMNLIGLIIQILFPCAPPWYQNVYGELPANYDMKGSPGGLARIDELFGFSTYTTGFTNSPQVFGAFPSLHSGSATIEALFLSYLFPSLRPWFWCYVFWIWWSTMYLTHHYFVDLIGGSCLAVIFFYIATSTSLPQVQSDKVLRWEYDYVLRAWQYTMEHTAIARIRAGSCNSMLSTVNENLELGDESSPSSADDVWSLKSNTYTLSSDIGMPNETLEKRSVPTV